MSQNEREEEARRIMEAVVASELDRSDGYMDTPDGQSDLVESILDALSGMGFFVVHESVAPSWMVRVEVEVDGLHVSRDDGPLYRVAGPDEEL